MRPMDPSASHPAEPVDLGKLYHAVFAPLFTRPGLRPLLEDLQWHFFVNHSTTDGALDATGRVDPLKVMAHEGRRTAFLRLKALVDAVESSVPTPTDVTGGLPGTTPTPRHPAP